MISCSLPHALKAWSAISHTTLILWLACRLQVPLADGVPVLLDIIFARHITQQYTLGSSQAIQQPALPQQEQQQQQLERHVLHVQSISSWAPSCIGPYSQVMGFDPDPVVAICASSAASTACCHGRSGWLNSCETWVCAWGLAPTPLCQGTHSSSVQQAKRIRCHTQCIAGLLYSVLASVCYHRLADHSLHLLCRRASCCCVIHPGHLLQWPHLHGGPNTLGPRQHEYRSRCSIYQHRRHNQHHHQQLQQQQWRQLGPQHCCTGVAHAVQLPGCSYCTEELLCQLQPGAGGVPDT